MGQMRGRAPTRWASVPMCWRRSAIENRCMIESARPTTQSHADGARQFDPESRVWLETLHSDGARYDAAIARLHSLLLSEARYQVRRRTAALAHPSGRDLDDLAMQAADDALVAILGKLDRFRGDALLHHLGAAVRRARGAGQDPPAARSRARNPDRHRDVGAAPRRRRGCAGNQRGGRPRRPARRADRHRADQPSARGPGRVGDRRGRLQGSRGTPATRLRGLSTRPSTTHDASSNTGSPTENPKTAATRAARERPQSAPKPDASRNGCSCSPRYRQSSTRAGRRPRVDPPNCAPSAAIRAL